MNDQNHSNIHIGAVKMKEEGVEDVSHTKSPSHDIDSVESTTCAKLGEVRSTSFSSTNCLVFGDLYCCCICVSLLISFESDINRTRTRRPRR